MVSKEDPEQPLAPAADRIPIDHDDNHEPISADFILPTRQQGCIKCCGCVSALLLILSVISLVLVFTLFRIKYPILKLNSFSLHNLNNSNSNFTIVIDVSVKNPNIAAFKFGNGTTVINYGDTEVGHGWISGGIVEAGRTLRMNTTVEVMGWKLLDMKTGEIRFNGYTKVGGRVKIGNLIKKHVNMNCIFTLNLKTMEIEDQKCNHKVPGSGR